MTTKQQKAILESLISLDYCVQTITLAGIYTGRESSNLKNFLNNMKGKLKVADEMFNKEFNAINDVQTSYEAMIKTLVEIGIEHAGEIALILKAFQKDSKSIIGIAKKVM
jgi:hypothetical protein